MTATTTIPPVEAARARGLVLVTLCAGLGGFLPIAIALIRDTAPLFAIGGAALLSVLALVVARGGGLLARHGLAIALMGQVMLITASLAGHPWQLDSHMIYFAALAVLVTLVDPLVLLTGAAVVAVHHVVLSLALPSLVYPGTDPVMNLLRAGVHGTILALETAVLIFTVALRLRQSRQTQADSERVATALDQAETDAARLETVQDGQRGVVDALRAALMELARGRVDVRIDAPFPDDYEDLREAFNGAASQLGVAIGDISGHTGSLGRDTRQITEISGDLASRSDEQARKLADATNTVTDVSGRMEASAIRAEDVRKRAETTSGEAERSMGAVTDATEAMERVGKASREIWSITNVIEDLAVQTNLLALNAGVEAARAGASGQGFAVVASEVRALAIRSSEATSQITNLIQANHQEIETGVRMVGETGDLIGALLESVRDVSRTMQEISAEVTEQSRRIGALKGTMNDLDTMTRQNAETAARAAEATRALRTVTDQLGNVVARFDFGDATANRSAA